VPVYWDLGCFHLPIRDAYARALHNGTSFDWLPGMHNGVFITGEGEHGPYHPLHLLLYRFLPLETAFALEAFLPFAFLFAGMILFLRRHAGRAGAFLGAIVYTFSANNFSHSFHVNFVSVMAHLPWLLWLEETLFLEAGPSRLRTAAAIALLTGSQLLLGHPQALSYSFLAESLYGFFLLPAAVGPRWAAAAWLGAKALGGAIGGVQVLATLAFLASSNRSAFDPFQCSLPPPHLLQLLVPAILAGHAPGWLLEPAYVGAVPVLLALWYLACLFRSRVPFPPAVASRAEERRLGWYAAALGVLATWLALGKYGGLYQLQTLLPIVGRFRSPARYLNLLDFALAVLAALAVRRLRGRRDPPPSSWRLLAGPAVLAGVAVVAAVVFRSAYPPDGPGFSMRFLMAAVCFVAAAVLLALAVRRRSVAVCALVLLAGWDLFHTCFCHPYWGYSFWRDTPTLPEYLLRGEMPPGAGGGRVLDYSWDGMRTLLRGERLVNGYRGGIEPKKRLDYESVLTLRLSGAAWYREPQPPAPALRLAGLEEAGSGWHRVPEPLPRVRLVPSALSTSDPARDLPLLRLEAQALCETPLDLEAGPPGKAVLVEDLPGRLLIDVEAPGWQLLVVAESHDPGWRAAIDGQPAVVERVNGDFLGCVVVPGRHTVTLTFEPRCLLWGRRLSFAGLAVALLLATLGLRSRVA
jgi:hypothetical protein